MRWTVLREGLLGGAVLGAFAAAFAVLGLTPSLSWIPEVPLLGSGVVVPLFVLGMTGYRTGRQRGSTGAGALAGMLSGAAGGMAAGLAYILYGKPAMNLMVGLVLGAVGGALVGAAGASWGGRPRAPVDGTASKQ